MIKQYFARQADPPVSSDPESELFFNLFEEFFLFRARTASPTSTAWAWPLTSWGPWWRSGRRSSRPTATSRPPMATPSGLSLGKYVPFTFPVWCIMYLLLLTAVWRHIPPRSLTIIYYSLKDRPILNVLLILRSHQGFLHWIHTQAGAVHQEDCLRPGWAGACLIIVLKIDYNPWWCRWGTSARRWSTSSAARWPPPTWRTSSTSWSLTPLPVILKRLARVRGDVYESVSKMMTI